MGTNLPPAEVRNPYGGQEGEGHKGRGLKKKKKKGRRAVIDISDIPWLRALQQDFL